MGAVTRANMKISAVNGTAFVDFSAADVLTNYLGRKLTITDSKGKKLVGYIKAAGTGETLDSELISSWTNNVTNPYETFTSSGKDITSAINTTTTGFCTSTVGVSANKLYNAVTNLTLNSGTAPNLRLYDDNKVIIAASVGAQTGYVTATATSNAIGYYISVATNFSVTASLKQVLTPSATGVTIVSTPGGTTYNWASVESGFNYYDASNYTYEIANINYAIAAGNWSATATWSAGTVPVADEEVDLNGYVVPWDAGVTRIPASGTLTSISSPGTAGQITLDLSNAAFSSGAALYATTITAGTLDSVGTFRITGTTSNVLTIICGTGVGEGIIGGAGSADICTRLVGTGTINIIGNVRGGAGQYSYGVINESTGTINITGDTTGGTGYAATGTVNSSTGKISISGDVTGGSVGNISHGINNTSAGQITLSTTTKLINGATGVAFVGYPPVWQPTSATYMYWYTGASFGQEPDTEFVRNLTAAEIKKGTVSGSVTGTLQTVVRPFRKIGTSVVGS